jgi:hypothetical protein
MSPPLRCYAWVMPNSSRVLGLGRSPQTAYQDALRRNGGQAQGYSVRITLDEYPTDNQAAPDEAIIGTIRGLRPALEIEGQRTADVPSAPKPTQAQAERAAERVAAPEPSKVAKLAPNKGARGKRSGAQKPPVELVAGEKK